MQRETKGPAPAGPSDTEIAWAAGLFEGEGCAGLNAGCTRLYLRLGDKDVLDRFAVVVGAGNVTGPYHPDYKDGYHRRPIYSWSVQRRDHVSRIIGLLFPLLGVRRQAKIAECFAADKRESA